MLCAYSNAAEQTINPGESALFQVVEVPCNSGLVRHRLGTGGFLLSGGQPNRSRCCYCRNMNQTRDYLVDVKADIGIPTGGTVGEITIALQLDNATVPATTMTANPAAVATFTNVSGAMTVDVYRGCCESVSVRNTSDQPIIMRNAYIVIDLPENRR